MTPRASTVIAVVAAGLLGVFAYRTLGRVPAPPPPTAANCTVEAIRQVADPMERAILSGQCAKKKQ